MKTKIITGVTVVEQMRRARKILEEQVIPREKQYQKNKMHLSSNG